MKNNYVTSTYAFLDSQNLNLGIRSLGWRLDFEKFRKYLADKYDVSKAFIFIGYVAGNELLYTSLQNAGYVCIFRPTLVLPTGVVKGNVDAELILHSMIEYMNYSKAILVTSDGDFFCLAQYLRSKGKLSKIIVPNKDKYSALLKLISSKEANLLDFMNPLRDKLEYSRK